MSRDPIAEFLAQESFAVAGASANRAKYGNLVLRTYQQRGRRVYAVNPGGGIIEGLTAYPDLASLPERVHGVSIITPPEVTERVVDEALALGIRHLWMQPGAESPAAVARAERAGANVIADGSCLLVVLGFRDR